MHVVIEGRAGLRAALEAGELRALAVMSTDRHPTLPDVPLAPAVVPGLVAIGWQALVAPKGTPAPIVERLANDLRTALDTAPVKSGIERTGTPFRSIFGNDLRQFIEAEQKLWRTIVKDSGSK